MALTSFFLNPGGLITALVLIPFLLLYLVRPKPKHETLPSLLFILKDKGKGNVRSFFRTFLKDILFLFHLLLFLLLIAAAAEPYIEVPRSALADQTVLIVDVSASMQEGDRLARAIAAASDLVGRENTIILVKGAPEILVERVSSGDARKALAGLAAVDTPTDLSGAIHLARGYAGPGTVISVISDFAPTVGDLDFETAADSLRSTGALVTFHPIAGGAGNIGIIDLVVGPGLSSLWVKNYEPRPAEVTLAISDTEQTLLLGPRETKEITFNTPGGVAEIALKEKDALAVDNTVWTSAPEKNRIKVLIITNDRAAVDRSRFLVALEVIGNNFPTEFDVEYAVPPKVPALDHDVYVLYRVDPQFVLPGYVKDILDQVGEGAALLLFPDLRLFSLEWQGLLPVAPGNGTGGRAQVSAETANLLTQDIQFGQVSGYTPVAVTETGSVLAGTPTDPLIVLGRHERGNILYFGLDEERSSFSNDPSYPVFWRRAFDLLTHRPSLENLNLRTGSLLSLPRATKVKGPEGTFTVNLLPLERAGLYTLPDRTIAVNMLSDAESALTAPENVTGSLGGAGEEQVEKAPKELVGVAAWAFLAVLLLELLYVKYRGDF